MVNDLSGCYKDRNNEYFYIIKNVTGDSDKIIVNFLDLLSKRVDKEEMSNILSNWNSLTLDQKADLAREKVGLFNTSRFIVLFNRLCELEERRVQFEWR